ncbi:hypothetical protein BCR43DRAFT_113560 [Syncephalastrum racemosum]|uniref:Uncharacterized protein n=1 Tax=Syncephalastrum racemosum TaxID=13706 RepID=A0A1X2H0E7_SYNRA|nr:hypothetical protein BCR43DRAFT_113560 [Syncephalastrum racemosum]
METLLKKNRCYICDHNDFDTKRNLRRHLADLHCVEVPAGARGISGKAANQSFVLVEDKADKVVFACPSCPNFHMNLQDLCAHVQTHVAAPAKSGERKTSGIEEKEEEEGEEVEGETYDYPLNTISPAVLLPNTDANEDVTTNEQREYDDAVLFACQHTHQTPIKKNMTLGMVDVLDLEPFAIMNDGLEHNALVHKSALPKVLADGAAIRPTLPSKRVAQDLPCECKRFKPMNNHLTNLLCSSPYQRMLQQRTYQEMNEQHSTLLNQDWVFHPQMKYAAAQLLAGAILLNTRNGQAVIINAVEAYGRKKLVDVHREPFGLLKNTSMRNSLPPPLRVLYANVWPTNLLNADGDKLVIGTQSMNALITSSFRLDQKCHPSLGAKSVDFKLERMDSLATRIYLDTECIQKAIALAKDRQASQIDVFNTISSLRQVVSKFDNPSTYYLCRAFGPLTVSHTSQPYSIFTLSDFDRGNNGTAHLFQAIAKNVLEHGKDACLAKETVLDAMNKANCTKQKLLLQEALDLYQDLDLIPIIKNKGLNKILSDMAPALASSISIANRSSALETEAIFHYLD